MEKYNLREMKRDKFAFISYDILREVVAQKEERGEWSALESTVNDLNFTDSPMPPREKRLNVDCQKIAKVYFDYVYGREIEDEGSFFRIAQVTWDLRSELKSLSIKDEKVKRDNYAILVRMVYERGTQCNFNRVRCFWLNKASFSVWDSLHSCKIYGEKDRDFHIDAKMWGMVPLVQHMTKNIFYRTNLWLLFFMLSGKSLRENSVNTHYQMVDDVYFVTDWCLQKCFEKFDQGHKSLSAFVQEILPQDTVEIDNEIRRFRDYYNKYMPHERSGNGFIPVSKVRTVKLLYLSSLSEKLLKGTELGKSRKKCAEDLMMEILGEKRNLLDFIQQAQILLALNGQFKALPKLLEKADCAIIDKMADYLIEPIEVNARKVTFICSVAENWKFVRGVALRLAQMTWPGKPLSTSRRNKIKQFVDNIDEIRPFAVRMRILKNSDKLKAMLTDDEWLVQQKTVLKKQVDRSYDTFEHMFTNGDLLPDQIGTYILDMVNNNFTSPENNIEDYHAYSTRYLSLAMNYIMSLRAH